MSRELRRIFVCMAACWRVCNCKTEHRYISACAFTILCIFSFISDVSFISFLLRKQTHFKRFLYFYNEMFSTSVHIRIYLSDCFLYLTARHNMCFHTHFLVSGQGFKIYTTALLSLFKIIFLSIHSAHIYIGIVYFQFYFFVTK